MSIRPRRHQLVLLAATGALVAVGAAAPAHASTSHATAVRYEQVNLVSDVAGAAAVHDPNLVNAWGMSASPSGPLWVSDNGSDTSTLYNGATGPGSPVSVVPLVVSIPGGGAPTGQVFNSTNDFTLPTGGPALFIFAGEDGDISAWNGAQGSSAALVAPSEGGVYKGLALVHRQSGNTLLAANFHTNRIDMFDSSFARLPHSSAFRSAGIPDGYAPFNVAVLGGRVYVTYAKQDADGEDDVPGPGHGYINVFRKNGTLLSHFASGGVLNSPWGLALAPQGFGPIAGDLLVGNFGNGRIHVFDLSGTLQQTLRGTDGAPLAIDGLWGLLPGNGSAGAKSDLWFSAGPQDESHGLLGILRVAG